MSVTFLYSIISEIIIALLNNLQCTYINKIYKELVSLLIGITVIYVRSYPLPQTQYTDIETIHEASPLRRSRVFSLFWQLSKL
jgi:hypothetical protein